MSIAALIERLEKLTGPDRECDVAIFRVLKPEYAGPEWQLYGRGLRHVNDSSDVRTPEPPERTPGYYTASIDAALTLVPEGMDYVELKRFSDGWYAKVDEASHEPDRFVGYQKPPAIALCIASLRARIKS